MSSNTHTNPSHAAWGYSAAKEFFRVELFLQPAVCVCACVCVGPVILQCVSLFRTCVRSRVVEVSIRSHTVYCLSSSHRYFFSLSLHLSLCSVWSRLSNILYLSHPCPVTCCFLSYCLWVAIINRFGTIAFTPHQSLARFSIWRQFFDLLWCYVARFLSVTCDGFCLRVILRRLSFYFSLKALSPRRCAAKRKTKQIPWNLNYFIFNS